ncbi:Optic atrophy 3 protein (OPA3) [Quillaja saponaria]|uniref:Optic atrophy 3 protein (OPA3) n=1 Tax=Quillaja saponaria TaxID=32244 RepID=A0AAD7QHL6_QUISA|nr:Optic atrophy 3 protein (OPA3) [Quillaja saponaria]
MILPVVKLGNLAQKTFCKPIANKLKKEAGLHPKFRHFIINAAQEKAVQAATDHLGELFVFMKCNSDDCIWLESLFLAHSVIVADALE